MFCIIYPVWDSIKNLWSFIIVEKFQAPLFQIFSLHVFFPLLLEFPLAMGVGHGLILSSMPLKLCDRHYQLVPTSVSFAGVPLKKMRNVVCLPSQIPLQLGWPRNRELPQSWRASRKPFGFLIKEGDVRHSLYPFLPTFSPTDGSDVWSLAAMFSHRETNKRTKNQESKDTLWALITLSSEPFLKLQKKTLWLKQPLVGFSIS